MRSPPLEEPAAGSRPPTGTIPAANTSARLSIVLLAPCLFGRHVKATLPLSWPVARRGQTGGRPGHAEVAQARASVHPDEHVLGRDVPVDNLRGVSLVVFEPVRRVEPREHVDDDPQGHLHRQALPALRAVRKKVCEGVALHVLPITM